MIKIVLCDDDQKVFEEVPFYINKYFQSKNNHRYEISCFDSATALINALEDEKNFDIYILDIYIGDEIGTNLAKTIRKRGVESPIIFLTTSIEHAPQSFETGTLRYLIKPLDPEKLYEAMVAAIVQVEKMNDRMVKFKTENGVESVAVNNIMCSESYGHYQYITLKDGKKSVSETPLPSCLQHLANTAGLYVLAVRILSICAMLKMYLQQMCGCTTTLKFRFQEASVQKLKMLFGISSMKVGRIKYGNNNYRIYTPAYCTRSCGHIFRQP